MDALMFVGCSEIQYQNVDVVCIEIPGCEKREQKFRRPDGFLYGLKERC